SCLRWHARFWRGAPLRQRRKGRLDGVAFSLHTFFWPRKRKSVALQGERQRPFNSDIAEA
ncbi:MAG: hypothetical protein KA214_05095, partial [Neisseriaceae bacterium]|nr:hypothetical protein [Neisseriaceae bacterium]